MDDKPLNVCEGCEYADMEKVSFPVNDSAIVHRIAWKCKHQKACERAFETGQKHPDA